MRFLKSSFLCVTIWVVSALLNSILSGTCLYLLESSLDPGWPGAYLIVFIFTLIFSVPAVFIFWLLLLVNWNEVLLFRIMLRTGLVLSLLSSLLLYMLPLRISVSQLLFLCVCILISSITSIMLHHSIIRSISINKDYA